MAQIRVGFQRVQAGAAAREAEQQNREHGQPRSLRIPAGSAARLAEDAKRAAAAGQTTGTGFSLRAEGGRVVRVDPAASAQPASAPLSPPPGDLPAPFTSSLRAGPPTTPAGRLQSFIRGFFLPEDPS